MLKKEKRSLKEILNKFKVFITMKEEEVK